MSDTYITPQELRYIADACETLTSLWELITTSGNEVSFELEDAPRLLCYDSNGDTLGFISWAEAGPAFYPSQPEAEKED